MFKEYQQVGNGQTNYLMDFITQHIPFVQDEDNPYLLWCDEEHNIGIDICYQSDSVHIYCNGDIYNHRVGNNYYSSDGYRTFVQSSKKGAVYYLAQRRVNESDSNGLSPNIVFAKDITGDWAIIIDSKLYYKNGIINISNVGIEPDYNVPFSATKFYNIANNAAFEELYKIDSATTFALRGTYVNFGGQGYRVVDARSTKSYDALPCYAFPVADV